MTGGRIAVTGIGLVSAFGSGATNTFERLLRGERAFSEVSLFDTEGQRTSLGAEVPGFRPSDVSPRGLPWSRSDALALVAAEEALGDVASLRRTSPRLGISVGVTTAGMLEAESLLVGLADSTVAARAAERLVSYPISSTATRLAEVFGPVHRVATVCSACSSGANAIVEAAAWLRVGAVDVALAGGTDALCRLTLTGFNALGATDLVPCRPFDRRRGGLTLGEGSAFLLLESERSALARGARVLAWLSGCAVGAEAHHVTQPEPSARMPARLIAAAIERAGLVPSDIDYVNAHGTGTVLNDTVETRAIHAAFGAHGANVLVSSSKGQIGHTLGAAGAIEAAITVLALSRQEVPPTGGLTEPGDDCRLNHVVGLGRRARLRAAASNAFGFGGSGAVLVFERAEAEPRTESAFHRARIAVTGLASIGPGGLLVGERCADSFVSSPSRGDPNRELRPLNLLDATRSRRFDAQASLVTAGSEAALRSAGLAPDGVGLVVGTAFGSVQRTVSFIRTSIEKGPRRAAPAEFPHLVPSAASGNASVYLGLSGPILTTSSLEASAEAAVALACDFIEAGFAAGIVAGSAEPHDTLVDRVLAPACEPGVEPDRTEGTAWLVLEPVEVAEKRGARISAVVRARYEIPKTAIGDTTIEPPQAGTRAVIASARAVAEFVPLLERSGWGEAPRLSVAESVGWHEGAGGFALVAAAALISAGQADEALVVGWDANRLRLFHLSGSR